VYHIEIIIIFTMEKRDKNFIKKAQSAGFHGITSVLESIPARGGIPEISDEVVKEILGTEEEVSAAAETSENNDVGVGEELETMQGQRQTVKVKQKGSKVTNADATPIHIKVGCVTESLEVWLEKAKKKPNIPLDKKYLVHYNCDTIKLILMLSDAAKVPISKILTAILEDWLLQNKEAVEQETKQQVLKRFNL
jgi:hypothetical protein